MKIKEKLKTWMIVQLFSLYCVFIGFNCTIAYWDYRFWLSLFLIPIIYFIVLPNTSLIFIWEKEKKEECNKQTEYVRSIMSVLEHQINMSETAHEPCDMTDWEERIGILLSREDAEAIVNFYYSTEQKNENKI